LITSVISCMCVCLITSVISCMCVCICL